MERQLTIEELQNIITDLFLTNPEYFEIAEGENRYLLPDNSIINEEGLEAFKIKINEKS